MILEKNGKFYQLSDDDIKFGDYFYCPKSDIKFLVGIHKCYGPNTAEYLNRIPETKKIVASSDNTLKLPKLKIETE